MKIRDIQIERFGAWRNLHLPMGDSDLTVVYGGNGAGKTTLMRFLRGMLYGFPPDVSVRREPGDIGVLSSAGTLTLESNERRFELRRGPGPDIRGNLTLTPSEPGASDEAALQNLLQGVDESVFERVFAVGLGELQELSTLQDGEVGDHIHGVSLGLDGQRLLDASHQLTAERDRWLDPATGNGEIAKLQRRLDEIQTRLRALDRHHRQHRELSRERNRHAEALDESRDRHQDKQRQLRGHLLMQRVWGPWKRLQQTTAELAKMPTVGSFPERGLERLEKLENDLAAAAEARQGLLLQARQLRQKASKLGLDPEMRQHASSIQSLLDQREWARQARERAESLQTQADQLKNELDGHLEKLGPQWTQKRLETADISPATHLRLAKVGRSFRGTQFHRARLVRQCKRLDAFCMQGQKRLESRLRELGGKDIDEALAAVRQRRGELENLAHLKVEATELQRRCHGLDEQRERLEMRAVLPGWVYIVLGFFGIMGLGLLGVGAITGLRVSTHVGAIYALAGLTCGGLAAGLKLLLERGVQEHLAEVDQASQETRAQLRAAREEILRLTTVDTPSDDNAGETTEIVSEQELIRQTASQISELEELARMQQRMERARNKHADRRTALQAREREVGTARQSWQDFMGQLGFSADLRVEEAFEAWRVLSEAVETRRQREAIVKEIAHLRWITQSHEQRIEELGRRMHQWDLNGQNPEQVLQDWETQLRSYATNRKERRDLRRDARLRLREAAEYQATIDDLRTQRAALLVQGGAANRDEFEERHGAYGRRALLETQRDDAEHDLKGAAQSEREVAVTEEDLRNYDAQQTSDAIELLRMEIEDHEREQQELQEKLGGAKHELRTLEGSRESAQLRFEAEQIRTQLHRSATEWFGRLLADQALGVLRANFERNCQSVTLADAARFLNRLTRGRYRNVWTPLGERTLCVEDDQQRTLRVEHLSRGTREQLFLAIRLALVQGFARQGIVLPMVLDDVLVNFDQSRAEAAAEVLLDFAGKGRQVLLFTCHQYLADLFASHGTQPIRLGAEVADERQEPDRMAG
ncbi:MAG TPA: AAA family ATPase [Planctomycetaceae bacterium]|nr:AAA family ATPase [Planctomycetaceae bacterium]